MRLPAVLLAATLALAGCHSDPDDTPEPAATTSVEAVDAPADPKADRARTAAIRQATADRLAQIAERDVDAQAARRRTAARTPAATLPTAPTPTAEPERAGTVVCQTDAEHCRRVEQATGVLPGSWPQLGWDIVAAPPHDWAGGMADSRLRTLTIHMRDDYTDTQTAAILAHEFGHAWWAERLDGHQRTRWRQVRDLEGAPLYANGPHDNTAVTEDHAEVVRLHLTGDFNGQHEPDRTQRETWQADGLLPSPPT